MRSRKHRGRRAGAAVAAAATAAALAAAGCGEAPEPTGPAPTSAPPTATPGPDLPAPGFHELTFSSGGEAREYLLDAPDSYDPDTPIPLIVVLHAGRSNAEAIRSRSGMAAFAQEYEVLVAYPQGTDGFWRPSLDGVHGVGVEWGGDPVDVDFLRELVAHLVDEWNAAPEQVYATGHSNGAAMSYRLAAEAADVFAAVAPVGGYIFDPPDEITPARPVSVVGFVGGNSRYADEIAEGMRIWRELRDCQPGRPEPVEEEREVTRTTATCRDGSEVVQYDLPGMRHTWPRQRVHGIGANEVMWEFFTAHGGAPE